MPNVTEDAPRSVDQANRKLGLTEDNAGMRRQSRWLAPFGFMAAVVLLSPFAVQALLTLGRLRAVPPVDCIGRAEARLRIVYLHGRDTYGPSWVEVKNRETLRALARVLDARVALPRTRDGWQKADADLLHVTAGAAQACFGETSSFGVLGFSDGGNAANQLYLTCRGAMPRWVVSVGSEASIPRKETRSWRECGPIALIAGRHEPTYLITRSFARQLQQRRATATFIEHEGVHELPFTATRRALAWVTWQ